MLTGLHTMDFDKVWLFDCFQRLARMSPLTAAFRLDRFCKLFGLGTG
jgi:hypothetical protein